MSPSNHLLTRSLTLIFTGATAITLFLLAFQPAAPLFVG